MIRRTLVAGCLVALVAGAVSAGDMADESMDAMATQMAKCDVCKHMAPHLPTLGAAMTMDMATLNDGVALMHGVSDPALLPEYRAMSSELMTAGRAAMDLTDEEAATRLCPMCQAIRAAMKAGAHMSTGDTKMGDVMVLTSDDPGVQKAVADVGTKCAMMMSKM